MSTDDYEHLVSLQVSFSPCSNSQNAVSLDCHHCSCPMEELLTQKQTCCERQKPLRNCIRYREGRKERLRRGRECENRKQETGKEQVPTLSLRNPHPVMAICLWAGHSTILSLNLPTIHICILNNTYLKSCCNI